MGQMAQGACAERQVHSKLLSVLPNLLVRRESRQGIVPFWHLLCYGEC